MAVDPEIDKIIQTLSGRARKVCDYITEHGFITTEVIEKELQYGHGPRAVRDVRESGIPIVTKSSKDSSGKRCARYEFGNPKDIIQGRHKGRTQFPKKFKEELHKLQQGRCAITGAQLEIRYLQVDHKIPYQVQSDDPSLSPKTDDFMLITGECQRQKSWSCEQCDNFKNARSLDVCQSCYWASPDQYTHMQCIDIAKIEVVFQGDMAKQIRSSITQLTKDELESVVFNALTSSH